VIEYTKCTRAEAIKVLRETDNDSVNAIMKLTKWFEYPYRLWPIV
jgi:NACalpha-BTF3-like transcription factor